MALRFGSQTLVLIVSFEAAFTYILLTVVGYQQVQTMIELPDV